MSNLYLIHYGIEGQKWGIRRYQNEDGSLTPEGMARYRNDRATIASDVDRHSKEIWSHRKASLKNNKKDYKNGVITKDQYKVNKKSINKEYANNVNKMNENEARAIAQADKVRNEGKSIAKIIIGAGLGVSSVAMASHFVDDDIVFGQSSGMSALLKLSASLVGGYVGGTLMGSGERELKLEELSRKYREHYNN